MLVQAAVIANCQRNGNGQISTPAHGSNTSERISMKLGIYNCVLAVTTHANPYGAVTTWVVPANARVTCHMLQFLSIPFFTSFFILHIACTDGPILMIGTSYDLFPPIRAPNFGCVNRRLQA